MSLEALIYGVFSIQGGVFSFGGVMWEIFSFGLQPYSGIIDQDVIEYIRKGRTLCRPDYWPLDALCWYMEPNNRPTFNELHGLLNELHQEASISDDGMDDAVSKNSDKPINTFTSDGMSVYTTLDSQFF